MQRVTFISSQPYLTLSFRELSITVQFIEHYYSTEDPKQVQLLREYAERTKRSYSIAEGSDPTELRREYEELEAEQIREVEDKVKAKLEAERARKEEHDFYSLLRMSDKAYR